MSTSSTYTGRGETVVVIDSDVVAGQSGLWWNGTLVANALASWFPAAPASQPAVPAAQIVVNASGSPTAGVNAHFTLLVDGVKAGEGSAEITAKDFAFTTSAAAGLGHKVQVQYDNDTSGRDLFVNTVTINGKAVAATAPIVSYDKGALDGRDVVPGQSGLWWNGTLVVNVDASYFPALKTAAAALPGEDATSLWQLAQAQHDAPTVPATSELPVPDSAAWDGSAWTGSTGLAALHGEHPQEIAAHHLGV